MGNGGGAAGEQAPPLESSKWGETFTAAQAHTINNAPLLVHVDDLQELRGSRSPDGGPLPGRMLEDGSVHV